LGGCLISFTLAALAAGDRHSLLWWPALTTAICFWWGLQWGSPAPLASLLQPLAVGAGLALLAEALMGYAGLGLPLPLLHFFGGCAAASLITAALRHGERSPRDEPVVLGAGGDSYDQLAALIAGKKRERLLVLDPDEDDAPPRLLLESKLAGMELETAAAAQERWLQRVPVEMLKPGDLLWPDTPRANRPVMALQAVYSNLIGLSLLTTLSPVLLVAGIVSRLAAGPGPLFEQVECAGFQGVPFHRRRFRTKHALTGEVTGPGRLLMRLRLTGLPQLINLVRGEMALFGPQPVRLVFSERLDRLCPVFSRRLCVKPGIFGWAQAHSRRRSAAGQAHSECVVRDFPESAQTAGRGVKRMGNSAGLAAPGESLVRESPQSLMSSQLQEEHARIGYDLYYLKFGSPLMDLEILGRTLIAPFFYTGPTGSSPRL
jgi:lipopolysaccharide/colanic/teichoic acid biosynthesis glycosyltransferase